MTAKPSFAHPNCRDCPYCQQQHLPADWKVDRRTPPLSPERNGSTVLLVLQAPGEEEWRAGMPLQPVVKQGGTTGRRVLASWERTGKHRSDFDITNIVQCFPGKKRVGGDRPPSQEAVYCCSRWLRELLRHSEYTKIISLGNIASDAVARVLAELDGVNVIHKVAPYPGRGVTTVDIDEVW